MIAADAHEVSLSLVDATAETPVLHVFNKMDRLAPDMADALRARITALLPNSVFVTARGALDIAELTEALRAAARARTPVAHVRIPAGNGKLIADVHRNAEVIATAHDEETGDVLLTARLDAALRGRVEREGITVVDG